MVSSQKFVSFVLLSLVCVSFCVASRSTFNDDDKKTNAQTQATTSRSTFNNGDDKKTNAQTEVATSRSPSNDDKKNKAQTQVTNNAISTYGGYSCGNNEGGGGGAYTSSGGGYTSGNCGSSSCSNGGGGSCSIGGGGSMSGCDSSSSNGGGGGSGGCMSGDCSLSPCQMPVHCTPQCPNVQPVQSPCTPQYPQPRPQPQPQPQPCNTCNQQPHCQNNDCGNGYVGVGSLGTDSEDPYYEKEDSEP